MMRIQEDIGINLQILQNWWNKQNKKNRYIVEIGRVVNFEVYQLI
jgi:hypothetical protein